MVDLGHLPLPLVIVILIVVYVRSGGRITLTMFSNG